MPQGVTKFLDLINCPISGLSKLIEGNDIDKRLIDAGFATLEELLPSVKFVRQRIRFVLFQVTTLDPEVDIVKESGKAVHEDIFLRDLEGLTDARRIATLPSYVSEMANVAYEAAKAFVEWFHAPKGKREIIKRCLCPLCVRFFKPTKDLKNYCSPECKETKRQLHELADHRGWYKVL